MTAEDEARNMFRRKISGLEAEPLSRLVHHYIDELSELPSTLKILHEVLLADQATRSTGSNPAATQLEESRQQLEALIAESAELRDKIAEIDSRTAQIESGLPGQERDAEAELSQLGPYNRIVAHLGDVITALDGEMLTHEEVTQRTEGYDGELIRRLVSSRILLEINHNISAVSLDQHLQSMEGKCMLELMPDEVYSDILHQANSHRSKELKRGDLVTQLKRGAIENIGTGGYVIQVVVKSRKEVVEMLNEGLWLNRDEIIDRGSQLTKMTISKKLGNDQYTPREFKSGRVGYVTIDNCENLGLSVEQLGYISADKAQLGAGGASGAPDPRRIVVDSGATSAPTHNDPDPLDDHSARDLSGGDKIVTLLIEGQSESTEFDLHHNYFMEEARRILKLVDSDVFTNVVCTTLQGEIGSDQGISGQDLFDYVSKVNGMVVLDATTIADRIESELSMKYEVAIDYPDKADVGKLVHNLPNGQQYVEGRKFDDYVLGLMQNVEHVDSSLDLEASLTKLYEVYGHDEIQGMVAEFRRADLINESDNSLCISSVDAIIAASTGYKLINASELGEAMGMDEDKLRQKLNFLVPEDCVIDLGKKLERQPGLVYMVRDLDAAITEFYSKLNRIDLHTESIGLIAPKGITAS